MDDITELKLLLRIAHLEERLAALHCAASRVVAHVRMPDHVTAASYSSDDTKRVLSRPLATLRNLVRKMKEEAQWI